MATAALQQGILNTAAFAFAYLARAEYVAGRWDDALVHAERAVAINLESDFGFLQSAVVGIAVLVPAGRGDWATAEAHVAAMARHAGGAEPGYERSMVALGMARARIGEARGDPAAVVAALAAGARVRPPGRHRRARLLAVAGPLRRGAGRGGPGRRGRRLPGPARAAGARARAAVGDRPAGPGAGPDRGRRRPSGGRRAGLRRRAGRHRRTSSCRSSGAGSSWPRAASCAAPGSGGGRPSC